MAFARAAVCAPNTRIFKQIQTTAFKCVDIKQYERKSINKTKPISLMVMFYVNSIFRKHRLFCLLVHSIAVSFVAFISQFYNFSDTHSFTTVLFHHHPLSTLFYIEYIFRALFIIIIIIIFLSKHFAIGQKPFKSLCCTKLGSNDNVNGCRQQESTDRPAGPTERRWWAKRGDTLPIEVMTML